MPTTSKAQHRFFGFLKSHPEEAAERGIKPSTVDEFLRADKGRVGDLPERAPDRREEVGLARAVGE